MTNVRYLFRGFHTEENGKETIYIDGQPIKGKWVFGNLAIEHNKTYIFDTTDGYLKEVMEIIPETIGQHVGLSDKNRRLIFENDVIFDGYDYLEIYFEDGSFLAKWLYADLEGYKEIGYIDAINNYCKVIGTKFDKEVKDYE